jgi:hypothetical protein
MVDRLKQGALILIIERCEAAENFRTNQSINTGTVKKASCISRHNRYRPDINVHESTGTLIHQLAIGDGLLQNTLAIARVSTGIDPQGNSQMILTPIGNQGNYFGKESRLATRVQWIENWRPRNVHFMGQHRVQIGWFSPMPRMQETSLPGPS